MSEITTTEEELREAITRYRRMVEILDANSYDHHTPYMMCVPHDKWKEAMALSEGRSHE